MGLVTLYIAVGFFFAWYAIRWWDGITPSERQEWSKHYSLPPDVVDHLRPRIVAIITIVWPLIGWLYLRSAWIYAKSVPDRLSMWRRVRRWNRWYDQVTDHLIFFGVEPEEFFAAVSNDDLVEMFDWGAPPLFPVKVYVRWLHAFAGQFVEQPAQPEQPTKEAA